MFRSLCVKKPCKLIRRFCFIVPSPCLDIPTTTTTKSNKKSVKKTSRFWFFFYFNHFLKSISMFVSCLIAENVYIHRDKKRVCGSFAFRSDRLQYFISFRIIHSQSRRLSYTLTRDHHDFAFKKLIYGVFAHY